MSKLILPGQPETARRRDQTATVSSSEVVIHVVLGRGPDERAACGFHGGRPPSTWPPRHVFVRPEQAEIANCVMCQRMA